VISFNTAEGGPVEFQSDDYTPDPALYKVGQRVRVQYVPAEPSRAEIDDRRIVWSGTVGICGFGLAWVALMTGCFAVATIVTRFFQPRVAADLGG
jgi:hypothetical protein